MKMRRVFAGMFGGSSNGPPKGSKRFCRGLGGSWTGSAEVPTFPLTLAPFGLCDQSCDGRIAVPGLMKIPLLAVCLFLSGLVARGDEIKPGDSDLPLFILYEPHFDPPKKDDPPQKHSMHAGQVLLTVHSLSDLLLQADKKGVRVVLNEEDTKTFATLTHKFQYLILTVGDPKVKVGVVMHISAPIEDGSILFNEASYSLPVAEYLRQRFHVKPDSNEFETKTP